MAKDTIVSEYVHTNPTTGVKTPMVVLSSGHHIWRATYDASNAAPPQALNTGVLEGGGSTLVGNGAQSGPAPAQMEPGPAPQIFAPPKTDAEPVNTPGTGKRDPYAFQGTFQGSGNGSTFQGNQQTPYGPAGQYAAMPKNMGGQSGFMPAPGTGAGNFGQNAGGGNGFDFGGDFGQVDESTEIQQQSQPAKPGAPGATPSAGYGPYPAAPWQ